MNEKVKAALTRVQGTIEAVVGNKEVSREELCDFLEEIETYVNVTLEALAEDEKAGR